MYCIQRSTWSQFHCFKTAGNGLPRLPSGFTDRSRRASVKAAICITLSAVSSVLRKASFSRSYMLVCKTATQCTCYESLQKQRLLVITVEISPRQVNRNLRTSSHSSQPFQYSLLRCEPLAKPPSAVSSSTTLSVVLNRYLAHILQAVWSHRFSYTACHSVEKTILSRSWRIPLRQIMVFYNTLIPPNCVESQYYTTYQSKLFSSLYWCIASLVAALKDSAPKQRRTSFNKQHFSLLVTTWNTIIT